MASKSSNALEIATSERKLDDVKIVWNIMSGMGCWNKKKTRKI